MNNTENNATAQAGDEPMRKGFEEWLLTGSWRLVPPKRSRNGGYVHPGIQGDWLVWQAAQVSPRATAGVERVTITPALLRAVDMTRADLGESGSNYPAVRELLAFAESHIATTKPGA